MQLAQYDVNKICKNREIELVGTERNNYFEGIGKTIKKATDLETAIQLSGLDFEVEKRQMAFMTTTINPETEEPVTIYTEVPKKFVTVRTDTNMPLGTVTEGYTLLQNKEAFDFLDSLAGECKFETAGNYGTNGSKSFITMSTEPFEILGDKFESYLLFTNSQDGSSSINVMFTPIRVFCSNCIVRAIKKAVNKITIRHSRSMNDRLNNARFTLLENTKYLEAIKAEAEQLAVTPYTAEQFKALVQSTFKTQEGDSEIIQLRNEELINSLLKAYNQDDLQNFNNSAYKAVQAIYDYASHQPAFRKTAGIQYKNLNNVIDGMTFANQMVNKIIAA